MIIINKIVISWLFHFKGALRLQTAQQGFGSANQASHVGHLGPQFMTFILGHVVDQGCTHHDIHLFSTWF